MNKGKFAVIKASALALLERHKVLKGDSYFVEHCSYLPFDKVEGIGDMWAPLQAILKQKGLYLYVWSEDAQDFRWMVAETELSRTLQEVLMQAKEFLAELEREDADPDGLVWHAHRAGLGAEDELWELTQ